MQHGLFGHQAPVYSPNVSFESPTLIGSLPIESPLKYKAQCETEL